MNLLLDTHILLWSLLDPEKLSRKVLQELKNDSNELWFSPITVWEILILAEKKRITIDSDDIDSWIREVLAETPLREAPLNTEIALQSRTLSISHQDPADRFLAATALVYELALVTADSRLINIPEIDVLANK